MTQPAFRVEPLGSKLGRLYEAHGFVRLKESMRLILPMRSVGALFQ